MKKILINSLILLVVAAFIFHSCKEEENTPSGTIQLYSIKIGDTSLDLQGPNPGMPIDQAIVIMFTSQIDTSSAKGNVDLIRDLNIVPSRLSFAQDLKSIILTPEQELENSTTYNLDISSKLKGINGETFPGFVVEFETEAGKLKIVSITLNGTDFSGPPSPRDVSRETIPFTTECMSAHD